MTKTLGQHQKELLQWLCDEWLPQGPNVCFLEGFSGVGKSVLVDEATRRAEQSGWTTVRVDAPESNATFGDDLLLALAQELSVKGHQALVDAIDTGGDLWLALERLLQQARVLVVIDEFQLALVERSGTPRPELLSFLQHLGRRIQQGRLLLVTNRVVKRERWSEACEFRQLAALTSKEAVDLLAVRLDHVGKPQAVPPERRPAIVRALGYNPRAIRVLAEALRYDSLDELIGEDPGLWSFEDRWIDADLLAEIEHRLLERTLSRLEADSMTVLERYCVYRKSVKAKAFKQVSAGIANVPDARVRLIDRFLVEHGRGWDRPHPLVREIILHRLESRPQIRRGYHSLAADNYIRHFHAQGKERTQELGGHFVEARYHLTRARRENELSEIAGCFLNHLEETLGVNSPVPQTMEELDERIVLLSGLLQEGGPWGLQYHLARCLWVRRGQEDLDEALTQIRRVCRKKRLADAWVLRFRLEAQAAKIDSLRRAINDGLKAVSPDQNLFALYDSAAELLDKAGRRDEAIDLLRQGIKLVPVDKGLGSLYQSTAELLSQAGRSGEAIDLLRDGIAKVPPQLNLFSLYQSCAELLARDNRVGEAIDLLRDGIAEVLPQFSLFSLYQSCAELLARDNRVGEAIDLLREGIAKVPSNYNQHRLVERALYLSAAAGRCDWIDTLIEGKSGITMDPEQRHLGIVLRRQLDGDWIGAAEEARRARSTRATYITFYVQESFSCLAAGRPEEAQAALESVPGALEHGKAIPFTWLACFVALRRGDSETARRLYALYLGLDEQTCVAPMEADLLRIWNGPIPLSTPHPAYYHSMLPPSLTGLAQPVRRPPTWMPCTTLSTQIHLTTGAQGETVVLKDVTSERSGLAILAMATEWQSRHGGLSTFNRELCTQLAVAGHRVVCVVPSAQATEIQAVEEKTGVTLVPATATPGADDISVLFRRLKLPANFVPDVVIGHGRITGPAAQAQVQDFFRSAFRVHFIHMAPGEIEWFKGKDDAAAQAEAREKLEVKLAEDAGLVVAVGPRLYTEVGNSLAGLASPPQLYRLDPGIDESPSRTPPPGIQCLVLGRAEDWKLKGLDIAARAMARTISSGIDFEYVPELVVRGAPKGSGAELRQRLLEFAGDVDLSVRVREYTADEDTIDQDLRRSSLVLMPSRREGFGLVALEALSAGTPILVSNKSGFGQLLEEHLSKAEVGNFVVQTPDAVEKAADNWADAIKFVLRDRQSAFSRTADLNRKLLSEVSWSSAVAALLDAIKRARS